MIDVKVSWDGWTAPPEIDGPWELVSSSPTFASEDGHRAWNEHVHRNSETGAVEHIHYDHVTPDEWVTVIRGHVPPDALLERVGLAQHVTVSGDGHFSCGWVTSVEPDGDGGPVTVRIAIDEKDAKNVILRIGENGEHIREEPVYRVRRPQQPL